MTIINHSKRSDVPVIIIDQDHLTDGPGLQELYEDIVEEVQRRERENVVLDFRLVDTVALPGLSMLIRAKNQFDERGAKLHLCGLAPNVVQVLRATAFHRLFPMHESVETALQAI